MQGRAEIAALVDIGAAARKSAHRVGITDQNGVIDDGLGGYSRA
jgi:hypothetical protein